MKKLINSFNSLILLFFLTGCFEIQKIYVWNRDDGDTFTMKYKITDDDRFVGIETYKAGSNSTAMEKHDEGYSTSTIKDYFKKCTVIDGKNFTCATNNNNEKIYMEDGVLKYEYWTEKRTYSLKHKINFF